MTIEKEIAWAYPTSPNAKQFHHTKEGCFTVSLIRKYFPLHIEPPKAIAGFPTLADARAYAETLPYPYSRYTR